MDVFTFVDYRKVLVTWLKNAKKDHRLSSAAVAEKLGVHPTFLSQVAKGNKELSAEHWLRLCDLMGVSEIEKDYLQFLLHMNRAGTADAKAYYKQKIDEILKRRLQLQERMKEHTQLTDEQRAIFYSSWTYSAIRLYCSVDRGQTIESLSEKFVLPKSKVEKILDFLCEHGLAKLEGGKFHLGDQHVHVPKTSPFVAKHHLNWRLKAMNSVESTSDEELHFTAPMAISKKDFDAIREKIVKLIQETIDVAKDSQAEDLAALTIDLFWPT